MGKSTKDLTKAELITHIKERTRKAIPLVKRTFYSGLTYKNKAELRRYLRNARVTRSGDISLL